MNITERAAYLRGLADGLGIDGSTKEGKVIVELLSVVGDMADKLEALDKENRDLREYIEEVDEDLGAVEDDLYEDEDEDDEDEDDEDADSDYYELVCPSCGETVCFDSSLGTDDLVCPACGAKIEDVEFCDGNCSECSEECEDREDK